MEVIVSLGRIAFCVPDTRVFSNLEVDMSDSGAHYSEVYLELIQCNLSCAGSGAAQPQGTVS